MWSAPTASVISPNSSELCLSLPSFKAFFFSLHETKQDKQHALVARVVKWGNTNILQKIGDC